METETKKCSNCGIKSLSQFNRRGKYRDGKTRYQSICKTCNARKCRAYYAANRAYHQKVVGKNKKRYIDRNRRFIYDYLLNNPCIECGEKHPCKLDFDHREDKEEIISRMVGNACGLEKLTREIKKCDVLCAGCHRLKTAKDQNWWMYNEYKKLQDPAA